MDTVAATPRNKLLGMVADALLAANDYAEKPDPVMPMGLANAPLALASRFLGLGGLARTANRLSYGQRVTNLGVANVPLLPDDTADAIMALIPAAPIVGKLAKGAKAVTKALIEAATTAPVGKSAQLGAIRVGGDPTLMPSHNTNVENLAKTLNNGTMELYSPSIGIKRNGLMTDFAADGAPVDLIPKVGAYDPQSSASTLFNRDAYTPRWKSYSGRNTKTVSQQMAETGGTVSQASEAAAARLGDRMVNTVDPETVEALKGAEGDAASIIDDKLGRILWALGGGDQNLPQAVAIADSPAFRSFEHYENSPLGANLLKKSPDYHWYAHLARTGAFQWPLSKIEPESMHTIMRAATAPNLNTTDLARSGVESAISKLANTDQGLAAALTELPSSQLVDEAIDSGRRLRQTYRQAPSGYAELKVHGPTPVTQENWAGAVMQPITPSTPYNEKTEEVIRALSDAGIPMATPLDVYKNLPLNHPMHPLQTGNYSYNPAFELADIFQKQAGAARKQPIGAQ